MRSRFRYYNEVETDNQAMLEIINIFFFFYTLRFRFAAMG